MLLQNSTTSWAGKWAGIAYPYPWSTNNAAAKAVRLVPQRGGPRACPTMGYDPRRAESIRRVPYDIYPYKPAAKDTTMPVRLTDDEITAFLDSKPGWIVLSTIGRDGFPHSVPVGYFRLEQAIYIGCRAGTQKLKNIARNPQVSLMLESGDSMQDIKGVLLQGHATVHTDPDTTLRLSRAGARLRGVAEADLPQTPRPGVAYIEVVPQRVISWDYSREAGA